MKKITITTRKSILAQWQANEVARQIKALSPDTEVEVMGLSTEGDRRQDVSLSTLGGKGVFVKELEISSQLEWTRLHALENLLSYRFLQF